jgi:hypothetical protein
VDLTQQEESAAFKPRFILLIQKKAESLYPYLNSSNKRSHVKIQAQSIRMYERMEV